MTADLPILSFAIWLPILGGLLVLASGDQARGDLALDRLAYFSGHLRGEHPAV